MLDYAQFRRAYYQGINPDDVSLTDNELRYLSYIRKSLHSHDLVLRLVVLTGKRFNRFLGKYNLSENQYASCIPCRIRVPVSTALLIAYSIYAEMVCGLHPLPALVAQPIDCFVEDDDDGQLPF